MPTKMLAHDQHQYILIHQFITLCSRSYAIDNLKKKKRKRTRIYHRILHSTSRSVVSALLLVPPIISCAASPSILFSIASMSKLRVVSVGFLGAFSLGSDVVEGRFLCE